jgi:hypothetical protein
MKAHLKTIIVMLLWAGYLYLMVWASHKHGGLFGLLLIAGIIGGFYWLVYGSIKKFK